MKKAIQRIIAAIKYKMSWRLCKECGKKHNKMSWDHIVDKKRKSIIKEGYCYDCAYWLAQSRKTTGDRLVVEQDGERVHYTAFPFIKGGGYSGGLWMYKHNDATKSTCDMWHQGDIPRHMYNRFPVNARFLPTPKMSTRFSITDGILVDTYEDVPF